MSILRRWSAVAFATALVGMPAWASGFSIYEQGAKASGQAGAWVARADDAAANWYNPAAILQGDGMQFQFGTNLFLVGGDTSLTTSAFGTPGQRFDAEGSLVTPSHFFFTHKINDRWGWGIGLNNPIGLTTEWAAFPVTLAARRSQLVTFVLNPNVAFAINPQWSVAVGVDYMYADVGEFSRDIDQSALLQQAPLTTIGKSDLTGDGDDTSWNVAVHYAGEAFAFGFTYRDGFDVPIDGEVAFSGIDPRLEQGSVVGQFCTGGLGCFPDGPGRTQLGLPAQAAAGLSWGIGDAWTMEFDLSWAQWSSFDELALEFGVETSIPVDVGDIVVLVPVVESTVLREDWGDTMAYRFGVAWALREKHELRFGAVYDESPVPSDTLRPSIPDADRTAVTIGYGFKRKTWGIDAYYMPLFFQDVTAVGGEDGVVLGTYESVVHLSGVTFNVRF